jgi:L-amino acid N-acyltransferase YncA
MSRPIIIRAANSSHITSIYSIHKHYVLNTIATFKSTVVTEETHLCNLHKVHDQKLPFLVALSSDDTEEVLGYTYVSSFRHEGYERTVELSLFCHPSHLYKGIGSALLRKLLEILVSPQDNLDFVSSVRVEKERIKNVIACMSLDPGGRDEGLGLKRWYEGFGFVPSGHLRGVGYKFDRWCVNNS